MSNRRSNKVLLWCIAMNLAVAAGVGCGDPGEEEVQTVTSALYQNLGHCPAFDDNSVCLCTDANLSGQCQIYQSAFGMLANPADFAPLPNDSVSSGAVGAFTQAFLINGANYDYRWGYVTLKGNGIPGSTPAIQNVGNMCNCNDFTSSFRVYPSQDSCTQQTPNGGYQATPVRPGTVRIFGDSNYIDGNAACVVLNPGNYPSPTWAPGTNGTFGNFGLPNDSMSSVQVAPGMTVRLWRDAATIQNGQVVFAGPSVTLTSDVPDLNAVGFNDTVSAVQVF